MSSTYRMRADRFLGICAVGLIVLGVAAILWAFGVPRPVIAVVVVLGGLIVLAGLWVLARPPVLLRLTDDEVDVRGLKTAWTDITMVDQVPTTQGVAIALRTKREEDAIIVPLRWLPSRRQEALQEELRTRLNEAHGYKVWDGTAQKPDDPAE